MKLSRIYLLGLCVSICCVSLAVASRSLATASSLPVAAAWGVPISTPVSTTFSIYKQTVAYTTPFTITDLREDAGDMIYSNKESFNIHTLTIYRAHTGQALLENQPVVFFVHGGGWTNGYMDWYEYVATPFTGEKGWVTVVIDYRLTADEVFLADAYCPDRVTCAQPVSVAQRTKAAEYPDNILDVAAAFNWVKDNIAVHGGNPQRIVAFGHSAGAHLVSLLATHPDYAALRPSLKGLVSLSGAYALDETLFKLDYWTVLEPTFGKPLNDAELQDASPRTHVATATQYPPVYLLYAETDLPLFAAQTTLFTQTLTATGTPYSLSYLAGYSHNSEMTAIQDVRATPTALIVGFINRLVSTQVFLPLVLD